LEFAREAKTLLGNPTTVTIPSLGQKILRSGTLFAAYDGISLDEGITSIEGEKEVLICTGKETAAFSADPYFSVLKTLESRHV